MTQNLKKKLCKNPEQFGKKKKSLFYKMGIANEEEDNMNR